VLDAAAVTIHRDPRRGGAHTPDDSAEFSLVHRRCLPRRLRPGLIPELQVVKRPTLSNREPRIKRWRLDYSRHGYARGSRTRSWLSLIDNMDQTSLAELLPGRTSRPCQHRAEPAVRNVLTRPAATCFVRRNAR
jgi:hypothetical protein